MAQDLLLEIGVEELPASFVIDAVNALPGLLQAELTALRLSTEKVWAGGTPRRLAIIVSGVAEQQPDLDAEVTGPPAKVAFDKDGKPTKAAESFAAKSGVSVADLYTVDQAKGSYVAARQRSAGQPAVTLLPAALARVCAALSFKKSMRWSDGDTTFGRPVRWLLGLFGRQVLSFEFAGLQSSNITYGHRFLAPGSFVIEHASQYVQALGKAHVIVGIKERESLMVERLLAAAKTLGGTLIEDRFLVGENASLVEDPQVVAGGFEDRFLALPERVILDVARDHQRYFGVRRADGSLMPSYLAVVNTAQKPVNIQRGNDRVMRARLSDAKFFYEEDLKRPLASRHAGLDQVMFQKRLGSVGDKVKRITALASAIAERLNLSASDKAAVKQAAELCKCDLVTLMVGEFPELQGEMGRAYALAQGVDANVADAIREHYSPKGGTDPVAPSAPGAVLALADRLDTLVGCCSINIMPTGSADPLGLRRAAIGVLRTLMAQRWALSVDDLVSLAFAGLSGIKLDLDGTEVQHKLSGFLRHRLRGLLADSFPQDVVDACLDAGASVPHDVALRVNALAQLPEDHRQSVGEVFKRAQNIAKDAKPGAPATPSSVGKDVHASEQALFDAFGQLEGVLVRARKDGDYGRVLSAISEFAPVLGRFFTDVFVMTDDLPVRENRLRMMSAIHSACSAFASFNLLGKAAS